MKEYGDYTIRELIEMGYQVDIYSHGNKNRQSAMEALSRFDGLSEVEEKESLECGLKWLKLDGGQLKVIAFYKEEKVTAPTVTSEKI